MFVSEVAQAGKFPEGILDVNQQKEYGRKTIDLYEKVAMLLMLSRIRPGSKTFDKVLNFLVTNVPYIQKIPGIRPVPIQEATGYPPEVVAFFKQAFGEDSWNAMSPEDQKKQVAKFAKQLKDGTLKLTAGPGGLRTRASSADQKKIQDVLEKYKAQGDKYFDGILAQMYRLPKIQYDARGYEYMIRQNPNLNDRAVELHSENSFNNIFNQTVERLMKDKSLFNQDMLDTYKNKILRTVMDDMSKVQLAEQYEVVFDLDVLKEQKELLNEGFFDMFGSWVKFILKTVLGDFSIPVSVKGNPREVEAFAKAIQGEKKYIDAIGRHGLNNKATYNSRAELARSIKGFERETGLLWPFN